MADIAPTAIDASSPKNGILMLVRCLLFGVNPRKDL
jgi:hypothetical protein